MQPSLWKNAQHTRVAYSVLLACGLLLAASCSNTPAPEPAAPQPASPTATNIPPTKTLTPSPSPTLTSTPTPDHSSLVTYHLCSPLAVQPLDQLSEIITQPFSMPRVMDNGSYKDDAHHGVDLGYYTRDGELFTGTPVLAALDGKIASITYNRNPYGDMVMIETPFEQIPPALIASQNIETGSSLYSLYAHLQNLEPFQLGQSVECGEQLAQTGLTGATGGPHLHFETRWGPPGATFTSMAYYKVDTTAEERANYEKWRMSGLFHLFDSMQLLTIKP